MENKYKGGYEIESLRAQVAEIKEGMTYRNSLVGRLEAERDELKAENERLEIRLATAPERNITITAENIELKRQNKVLRDALNEINNWLVCACIASAEDMAQSFADMQQLADTALDTTKEKEDGL